jgi:hypothetical protein
MEYSLPFSQVLARQTSVGLAADSKDGEILLRFEIDMASGIPLYGISDVRLQL